jgi:SAM-dependent methyltransferase
MANDVSARELAHHEQLYSGEAQRLFAQPAVRALRRHMVGRILAATQASGTSRVLSLGCGIGDTEILLAPHVRSITAVDLSPAAIRQAQADAAQAGIGNATFLESEASIAGLQGGSFDVVIGIFFLHHLPDAELREMAKEISRWLVPGGVFYGLDPNRYRLSGAIGSLLLPRLMRHYQTPDERELRPADVRGWFGDAGFNPETRIYDFLSTPLAGLLPAWRSGYRCARMIDEALIRTPGLRLIGSNFEVIARKP